MYVIHAYKHTMYDILWSCNTQRWSRDSTHLQCDRHSENLYCVSDGLAGEGARNAIVSNTQKTTG